MANPGANSALERGLAAFRGRQFSEAEHSFKSVLRREPKNVGALNLLGLTLTQLGKLDDAENYLRRAVEVDPRSETTLYNYATLLKAMKRPAEAVERFTQALALNPSVPETWNNRGTALNDLRRFDEAIADFDAAIRLNPQFAEAFANKVKSLASLNRFADAMKAIDAALALKPDLAEAWCSRGDVCWATGRHDEAGAAFEKALSLRPNLAEAWLGLANVLVGQRRNREARHCFEKALEARPDFAEAWFMFASFCAAQKNHPDAAIAFDRAVALRPDLFEAWLGRGASQLALGRAVGALVSFDRAVALKPDSAEAWLNRASALNELKQIDAALIDTDKALNLNPDFAEAWLNRGAILFHLNRYAESIAAFASAVRLKPHFTYASAFRIYAKMLLCDWTNLESETAECLADITERGRLTYPFMILPLASSPEEQFLCATRYVDEHLARAPAPPRKAASHDRIRIAYLSADFHDHPVMYLLIGLLEHHDRSRFEVTGISFGPEVDSPMRQRISNAVEHFIDLKQNSREEIEAMMRDREIDIAVDLMGHTQNARTGVLSRRAAPVQVSYLGYLGTMGADFIDYLIADEVALPFDHQDYYSERIVHLPDCFVVNDALSISPSVPSRREAGLPETGFVFCSFNNSYKLNPAVFEAWMRLLKAVDGSVLWLVESNPEMIVNLRAEARKRGIDETRIIFAPRIALPDHLARHRLADLFLDSTPYNAGATGAAALWAGLPILTVKGTTFVGRMAASMLHAVGLPELVAGSLAEYEAMATRIATDPALCASLKEKLARSRSSSPLFNAARYARNIEKAYQTMWTDYNAGRKPVSFAVTPEG